MPRQIGLAAFVLAAAACCVACRGGGALSGHAPAGDGANADIVIGVAWPWKQRPNMLYGQGLEMAVEEINARGGVAGRRIRLWREDDAETVEQGRIVAQRFTRSGSVAAVIGHLQSYVSEPAAAIYDVAGLVMIVPAATARSLTTHGYGRLFRTIFTDDQVGREMAEFAVARGYRRCAIYYMRSVYGREIANAFEERATEAGLTVVDRQSYDPNVSVQPRSLVPVLEMWRARSIDAIFIAGEGRPAAVLSAEAKRLGLTVPVLGADAMGTPDLFAAGAQVVEGTVVPAPFHADEPRAEVRRFVEAFVAKYGQPPDAAAAQGYDGVRLYAYAVELARSTQPDAVATVLRRLDGWKGVAGPFAFTDQGDLRGRAVLKMVARNGRFAYLPPEPRPANQPPSSP
jgi:branched-chain amino acid transport system substrate-binding protein